MVSKIPIPKVIKKEDSKAHPYPFVIALQTMKFTQGAIFYFTLMDTAASEYFRQGDQQGSQYLKIKSLYTSWGYSEQTWETSWSCFEEYMTIFPKQIWNVALITLKSHWDWYMTKLGEFVCFAKSFENITPLRESEQNALKKIGFRDITSQFSELEKVASVKFEFSDEVLNLLREFSLVRNLGIHNQWEVDDTYLKLTKKSEYQKGVLRFFNMQELEEWQRSLQVAITQTSQKIAERFVNAPNYS